MTSPAAPAHLERTTVNAALWGGQAADLRAELAAAELVDPWCAAVVSAIAEVDDGGLFDPHLAVSVHAHLVAHGHHTTRDFWRLVMADVEPDYLLALPYLLDLLAEAAQRRRLLARLTAMASSLEYPGGTARVAAALSAMADTPELVGVGS